MVVCDSFVTFIACDVLVCPALPCVLVLANLHSFSGLIHHLPAGFGSRPMSNSLFNKDLSSKPMRFALKESTSLEKFAESFRTGLFGAFYLLCQQTKRPSTVCMFYNVLEVIQMLAFPLSGDGRFPWANGGHFGGWYFSHYMRYFIMLDVGKAISEVNFLYFEHYILYVTCVFARWSPLCSRFT